MDTDALSRNNIPLFFFSFSTDSPHSSFPSIGRISSCPDTRLRLRELDESVQGLLANGIAPSTHCSYRFGEKCYRNFCSTFKLTPFSLTDAKFCHFVVHLHLLLVQYRTICSYFSAVRYVQIVAGLPDPNLPQMTQLTYVISGIQRTLISLQRRFQSRHLMTMEILRSIWLAWSKQSVSYERHMLWADFCVAFFGLMRAGELTWDPPRAMEGFTCSDVQVNSHESPGMISIFLRAVKQLDQAVQGAYI